MMSKEVLILCGIPLITYVFADILARRRRLPKPPGPSFREIDPKAIAVYPWKGFRQWSLKYGSPIISWTVLGKTTVVIDSAKVAQDLLEARSSIYSDRPLIIMAAILADHKHVVPLASSQDPRFKIYRRLMTGGLGHTVIREYQSIQIEELRKFLRTLERTPEDFRQATKRSACALMMKVAYGYELTGPDDEFIRIAEEGFATFMKLGEPGRWLVEFLPWLRFVPAWFPGAGFKRFARQAKPKLSLIEQKPLDWALEQIASGKHVESFASKHLDKPTPYIPDHEKLDCIKYVAGSLYGGGVDTTGAVIISLFYVMQMYPEVQRKAQKEIDALTGGQRMLGFDDYESNSLPYINAIIKELLRWGPVLPLAAPHAVTQDDIYEGYLIPKNTTVYPNVWAIVHDPELYPEPDSYDPERHLGDNPQPDPYKWVWGFGRRTCPGIHLAQASLFLNISNILALFDISKEVDTDGKEIEPLEEWVGVVAPCLKEFPCRIKVRSPELLASIDP